MKNLLPLDDEYMALLRQIVNANKSGVGGQPGPDRTVLGNRQNDRPGTGDERLGQRGGGAPGCRFEIGVSGYGWVFPPTALFHAAIFYFLPRS